MRPRTTVPVLLLLCALGVAAISGCSQLPTDPAASANAQQNIAPARTAEGAGLISTTGSIINGLIGMVVRTLQLVGSIGGSLTNGRWRVVVPANAVQGTVTIALGVPDATSPDCQLEIWPGDRNHFDKPVTLIADCRNVPTDRISQFIPGALDRCSA